MVGQDFGEMGVLAWVAKRKLLAFPCSPSAPSPKKNPKHPT